MSSKRAFSENYFNETWLIYVRSEVLTGVNIKITVISM